jgi:glycosyltransferase involved in cell wall biosynthesis
MPAYEAERYINRAIDSILAQTLEDFELIVYVDDGTDRTLEIAETYAERDDRVRVYGSAEQHGMCVALNRAIDHARSPLIGRMDADDVADPARFAKLVDVLENDPEVVVVGSNAVHINEDDEVLGLSIAGPTSAAEFHASRGRGEITMVLDGTAAFRKDVFDAVGGYDPDMAAAPEVDLHARMAAYGVVVALQEPLLMYRLHPGSSVAEQFFEGRAVHRYVEAREKALLRGEEHVPSFQEFLQNEQAASWWERTRIRRQDLAQFHYRAAGVLLSEGRKGAAIVSLGRGFVMSPRFVMHRAWQRRFSPEARERLRSASITD